MATKQRRTMKKQRIDSKGTVAIKVFREDAKGKPETGNKVVTFRVDGETVSNVATFLDDLFVKPDRVSLPK